jgi:hypothetical protein
MTTTFSRVACQVTLVLAICGFGVTGASSADKSPTFTMNSHYFIPPDDMAVPGDMHGDIAVSPAGDVYVSVIGGKYAGIQVYSPNGHYLRNVPNAPTDLHGFIIATGIDGKQDIIGVQLRDKKIIELSLDGKVLLSLPAEEVIPAQYLQHSNPRRPTLSLTDVVVAPNGNLYVTDGYGLSYIHVFDKNGHYIKTFGGEGPPWNFHTAHKLVIDTRFSPARLLLADRENRRLVSMDLDGNILSVFGQGMRLPAALAIRGDELAVAELEGRLTILNKNNEVIATIGQNDNSAEVHVRTTPVSVKKEGLFYAPHGVAYDASGNLFVSEFSMDGRITRVTRN